MRRSRFGFNTARMETRIGLWVGLAILGSQTAADAQALPGAGAAAGGRSSPGIQAAGSAPSAPVVTRPPRRADPSFQRVVTTRRATDSPVQRGEPAAGGPGGRPRDPAPGGGGHVPAAAARHGPAAGGLVLAQLLPRHAHQPAPQRQRGAAAASVHGRGDGHGSGTGYGGSARHAQPGRCDGWWSGARPLGVAARTPCGAAGRRQQSGIGLPPRSC
jgi:hypothetical protein